MMEVDDMLEVIGALLLALICVALIGVTFGPAIEKFITNNI